MKESDAYGKCINEFLFADTNKNHVIDDDEMKRYNGPLLVVEKEDISKQRFVGSYEGTNFIFSQSGNINMNIITDKELEYYPGQKYDEVNETDFKLAFSDLDLNADKELSSEEIEKY